MQTTGGDMTNERSGDLLNLDAADYILFEDKLTHNDLLSREILATPTVKVKNTFIEAFLFEEDSDGEPPMCATRSCPAVHLPGPQQPPVAAAPTESDDDLASVPQQLPLAPLPQAAPQRRPQPDEGTGGCQLPEHSPPSRQVARAVAPEPPRQPALRQPEPRQPREPTAPVQPQQQAAQQPPWQGGAEPAAPGVVPLGHRQLQMSVGAALHESGQCRPCAWYWRPQGCANGEECRHCHLCPAGEVKARRKTKIASLRTQSRLAEQRPGAVAAPCSLELTRLV